MKNSAEITEKYNIISTGNELIDKFLGNNGAVQGGLYFLYGPAGSSKSTFSQCLLKIISTNENNINCFFSNEQKDIAIKENSDRIKMPGSFNIDSDDPDVSHIKTQCLKLLNENPGKQLWIVVDALQGVTDVADHPTKHGIEAHIINVLRKFSAEHRIITILIGHVNKKGQYAGPTTINHNIDVELKIENDSNMIRSIYVKKNRFGASGKSIRLNLENNGFEIMAEKNIAELDFSNKEDLALMPKAMRLMKENSIMGKIAQETMRQGTGVVKKAVIGAVKNLFKKKKK